MRVRVIGSALFVVLSALAPVRASAVEISGTTALVSVAFDGSAPDHDACCSAVSDDGRFVAFGSGASNLVADDANGFRADVFVRDMTPGTTELASVRPDGEAFVWDSYLITLSGDGRYVYFLAERRYSETYRVWVRDRTDGTTTSLVQGVAEAAVSADGTWLAYSLFSDTTPRETTLRLRNLLTSHDREVVTVPERWGVGPSIANTGDIAFHTSAKLQPGDTDRAYDPFLWTRTADSFRLIPQDASGSHALSAGQPAISADGSAVVFRADAWILWQRSPATWTVIDEAPYNEFVPLTAAITPDGRFVVYTKGEANEHGSTSIHLFDAQSQTIERVDVNEYGWATQGDAWTMLPAISADGRFVAFTSNAPGLVPRYASSYPDVFLRDRAGTPRPGPLPDLMIWTPDQPFWRGDGVIGGLYEGTWMSMRPGETETVRLRVVNRSPFDGAIAVRGPGSMPRVKLHYLSGGVDVTAAVVAGTFTTRALASGEAQTLRLTIHVPRDVRPRTDVGLMIRASSVAVPEWRDVMGLGVSIW